MMADKSWNHCVEFTVRESGGEVNRNHKHKLYALTSGFSGCGTKSNDSKIGAVVVRWCSGSEKRRLSRITEY